MSCQAKIAVAVPVKDEETRIGAFLAAMARQIRSCDTLLLLLNNCTDGTAAICRGARLHLNLKIIECTLPGHRASAGEARRVALEHALALAGDGVILTTDADAIPEPDWIAKNLVTIGHGADVVCGQACIETDERLLLPRGLLFDDMKEGFLVGLLDEIESLVDPDPADPWPRHQQHSGASIAMRAAMLRKAGGAPHVTTGEDRALVERLRLIDAQVRHDPGITVPVSGRLDGRAIAGMAATMKRRIDRRDALTDDRLEPTVDSYRRSLVKARLRACRRDGIGAAAFGTDLLIGDAILAEALQAQYFGAAWAVVQAASPILHRRRVAFADMARETRQAIQLRDSLLMETAVPIPAGEGHDAVR